ncbi:MAG: type II toxin-antitoxin system ParD family antitoxin [Planctomycetaceae bacterium]|nr:type II toxin-antitoxin system ParD family antitoxin [Planctomycetaceae bacterium]
MNVTLPSELQSFVDQLVASGAYSSPEAVVREAMERLRNEHAHFQELKASFDEAVAELDRGEGQPLDFAEIKRKTRELYATRHSY